MTHTGYALSVRQPWAEMILTRQKKLEYRITPFQLRGRVWIYTGKQLAPDLEYDNEEIEQVVAALPRGVIVGSVMIMDCIEHGEEDMAHRPWGLVLRKPVRLPQPIKAKGSPQPGLWVPDLT